MRPLPRSLDPLTGESLPGYLLRLAHRLGLSPGDLMRRTGLAGGRSDGQVIRKASLALVLPADAAAAFAAVTRLTPAEVTGLTLAPWRAHYPPIGVTLRTGPAHRLSRDPWLFPAIARYCPQCLAGDTSPIQQMHGGPWKKSWRLPIVFSCPEHLIFLKRRCPECRTEIARAARGMLIGHTSLTGKHPAQCRVPSRSGERANRADPICGARLDNQPLPPRRSLPAPVMLNFQRQLMNRLNSEQPSTEAAQYFTDLRLVTTLISTTWPEARPLMHPSLTEAVDQHFHTRQQRLASSSRVVEIMKAPPVDAHACAGLLTAADQLLRAPDLRGALAPLVARDRSQRLRGHWSRAFERHGVGCSDKLGEEVRPLLHTYRRDGQHGPKAPLRSGSYRPEHIPAHLQDDWFRRHFNAFTGISPKILRRTAAVRLVQMAAGGSLKDAAEFLGVNPDRLEFTTATDVHRWMRAQQDPRAFDTALDVLAEELDSLPSRIDYLHRRREMMGWSLASEAWSTLVSELPPTAHGSARPVLNDRKRQDASVYIWVFVTQGEHLFAPRHIERAQPEPVQEIWARRRNTTWFNLARPDTTRHYAELAQALRRHGEALAREVDSKGSQQATT